MDYFLFKLHLLEFTFFPDDLGRNLRLAAQEGDLRTVDSVLGTSTNGDNIQMINSSDENGWQALHEAVRAGNLEVSNFYFLAPNIIFYIICAYFL